MTKLRLFLVTSALLALAVACSKQGEGERCNRNNNSNDCEDWLVCTASLSNPCPGDPTKEAPNCQPAICCPPSGLKSRLELCNQYSYYQGTSTGGAGSTGTETGGSGAVDQDASDSSGDAGP